MNNIHAGSFENNTQMCPNRWNMHILFYEQAVYERGTKMEKGLFEIDGQ